MSSELSSIPIIVLCGGQGTRLRPAVCNRPKILAQLGAQTLLDLTMHMLRRVGFSRIILSVGYRREQIKAHCKIQGYAVEFSEERAPLGTGGALKAAAARLGAPCFCAMNGDMIFDPDFHALYRFHRSQNSMLSIALTRPYGGNGGSIVELDAFQRIVAWREKTELGIHRRTALLMNAGVYIFEKKLLNYFPKKQSFSLEREVFPFLFTQLCYGFVAGTECLDIGTPERYAHALTHFVHSC